MHAHNHWETGKEDKAKKLESEDLPFVKECMKLREMTGCRELITMEFCDVWKKIDNRLFEVSVYCVGKQKCDTFFMTKQRNARRDGKEKFMTKHQKKLIVLSIAFAAAFGIVPQVNAMHIMEGYLPLGFCIGWGVICIPFLLSGFFSIQKKLKANRKNITLIAMAGAFVFVISSLKIPSVTGSCSHMTGTGLGAILFGPSAVSVLGIIVLIFQAILLAHGGLTTLGANTFSMAIAGPFVSYGIFVLLKKLKVNRRVSVFLAAMLGDLFTYCVTSVQLALAYPSSEGGVAASAVKFLGVFAPTQLPLAIIEGFLTVIIMITLENYAQKELKDTKYLEEA